ncbi:MAG: siderophore ABC transporter permease [Thermomicrobiales bacterium]|nr:MAG: siderophore ABC transporter permease [Thermomicrobiales bacterium]
MPTCRVGYFIHHAMVKGLMHTADVHDGVLRTERQQARLGVSRAAGLGVALAGVVLVALLSLGVGSRSIGLRDVWEGLTHYDAASYDQTVIRSLRLPRTIIGLAVGGSLAVAGAMMQAVTRNPLADPSILGVSSGASFTIVTATYAFGLTAVAEYLWFAFVGALGAGALVFLIASSGRDGPSPVKLTLAGVVVSGLLGAWTSALIILDEETLDVVRFWLVGSVAGRSLETFWVVAPFLLGGTLVCLFLGHQLNVLSLGDETARALGMRTARIRLLCSVLVVVMTGAAVSVAGPIGFVGLATPHIVRSIVGPDYRWVLPYSLLTGAIVLTGADVIGRVAAQPSELQTGLVTALVGSPVLIYLARQRVVAQ